MSVKKPKKLVWLVLLLLLLCAGGGGGFYYFSAEEKAQKALSFVDVTRGDLEETVTATGTLEPKDYVDVGAQVSGQIKKLYVEIGDTVKKGDLLAEIDPETYQSTKRGDQAKLDALQAQLLEAQAQADYDSLQYMRAQKLFKVKGVSKEALEEKDRALKVAQASIKSIEAQIDEAKASLEKDEINLGYTKIYAPIDGVVTARDAREGQTLNANQTTPTILTISDLNTMTVNTEIAEADVMRLEQGMEASFTTLGSTERKWIGKVRQILPTPEVVNDVVLYNALIDVANEDGQLMNGMSTQTYFTVASAKNVLILPTKGLGIHYTDQDSDKGKIYEVQVQDRDGNLQKKNVLVGLMTRSKVEIRNGLQEGDRVVVSADAGLEADSSAQKNKDKGPPGLPGMGMGRL